jgi:hypothetical protein
MNEHPAIVAALKAIADNVPDAEVDKVQNDTFWDAAMRGWFSAHAHEYQALMVGMARLTIQTDGAVALLALYVLAERVHQALRNCPAHDEIDGALRRLSHDLADSVPRSWNVRP